MNARPSVTRYLVHESAVRWRSRPSVPLARFLVAAALSTTALLVLASFALALSTLEARIDELGLDTIILRTPLRMMSDPAPDFAALREHGRTLTFVFPYATATLDAGRQAAIAFAGED